MWSITRLQEPIYNKNLFHTLTNRFGRGTNPVTDSSRSIPSSVTNCSTGFFNLSTSG
jgi:hypothetical protein